MLLSLLFHEKTDHNTHNNIAFIAYYDTLKDIVCTKSNCEESFESSKTRICVLLFYTLQSDSKANRWHTLHMSKYKKSLQVEQIMNKNNSTDKRHQNIDEHKTMR